MGIKLWNGSWVDKSSGGVKIWNGGSWQNAQVRAWNGGSWQVISATRKTKQWDATWTQSYWGGGGGSVNNQAKPANRNGNYLYQGRYGSPDTSWRGDVGIQKGMMGFDDNDIRNSLRNAKIEKVELYLRSAHWWYWAGGRVYIGCHNSSGWQNWFSNINYNVASARYTAREQEQWITLPNWVGDNLRDNKLKGLTTYANSSDPYYYGYFFGTNSGWKKPKLRITYVN